MKSILLALFSLCLTCATFAATARLFFLTEDSGTVKAGPVTYDVAGTELFAEGEVFRLFYCVYNDTYVGDTSVPPFTFDRLGQIIVSSDVQDWRWGVFGTDSYVAVGEPGFPAFPTTSSVPLKSVSVTMDSLSEDNYLYLYLVVMDTRVVDMTRSLKEEEVYQFAPAAVSKLGEPDCVAGWAAVSLGGQTTLRPKDYSVNCDVLLNSAMVKRVDLTAVSSTAPTAVVSLMINGTLVDATDGENDIEDQATIDAYLSPSVSGLVADADGNYTLTASSSGQIPYKLQTRESLSSGEWEDVDTWLTSVQAYNSAVEGGSQEGEKKVLANEAPLYYNWLRIGQGSSLPLPRVLGEPTRFYRLKGE